MIFSIFENINQTVLPMIIFLKGKLTARLIAGLLVEFHPINQLVKDQNFW